MAKEEKVRAFDGWIYEGIPTELFNTQEGFSFKTEFWFKVILW